MAFERLFFLMSFHAWGDPQQVPDVNMVQLKALSSTVFPLSELLTTRKAA